MAIYMLIKRSDGLIEVGRCEEGHKKSFIFLMKEIQLLGDLHEQKACKYWCNRLLELAARSQTDDKETVDQKGDSADDCNGSSGTC